MRPAWLVAAVVAGVLPAQIVTLPSEPIVFGQEFELTIVAEQPFDEARLRPLVVEVLSRTPKGQREQLHVRARCYELGEVSLGLDPPQTLRVVSCLPEPAGELEWPGDGWQLEPTKGASWVLWGLLAAVAAAAVLWWRRKPLEVALSAMSGEPQWDALAALRDLAGAGATGDAFYQQLKAIVRKHCAVRFHLPADVRTSEELLQALPKAQPTLQPCLMTCDVVLFGGAAAADLKRDAAQRDGARDHAIQFVEATQVTRSVEAGE